MNILSVDIVHLRSKIGHTGDRLLSLRRKKLSPQTSFQILNILEGAVERGTAKSLNKIDYPLAENRYNKWKQRLMVFGLTPRYVIGIRWLWYSKSIGYRNRVICSIAYLQINYWKLPLQNKNTDDKFIVPSDLIIKKVNIDSGLISNGQNTIIDYFTKEQLKIMDNKNNWEYWWIN